MAVDLLHCSVCDSLFPKSNTCEDNSESICSVWNFVGLLGLLFCYKPPKRHNVDGESASQILSKIDYIGAFLSIGGVTLFLVGLQAGGYQYPWTAGKVLGPLIIGLLLLIVAFPVWEIYGAKNPMVPGEIFQGQRVVALALMIVFIAGTLRFSDTPTFLVCVDIIH